MRPTTLHNMENIIQNVKCTANQSMSHHESNNPNTCGTTSALDHQPLKQSVTAKMRKRKQAVQKTYNSKCKQRDSARTIPANFEQVYMKSTLLHKAETRTQDNAHNNKIQTLPTQQQKYRSNPEESLQIFNDNVLSGPVFVYTYFYKLGSKALFSM